MSGDAQPKLESYEYALIEFFAKELKFINDIMLLLVGNASPSSADYLLLTDKDKVAMKKYIDESLQFLRTVGFIDKNGNSNFVDAQDKPKSIQERKIAIKNIINGKGNAFKIKNFYSGYKGSYSRIKGFYSGNKNFSSGHIDAIAGICATAQKLQEKLNNEINKTDEQFHFSNLVNSIATRAGKIEHPAREFIKKSENIKDPNCLAIGKALKANLNGYKRLIAKVEALILEQSSNMGESDKNKKPANNNVWYQMMRTRPATVAPASLKPREGPPRPKTSKKLGL